jgi:small subunit ribosomal protein S20
MANIKSQKKRIITSEKARVRNVNYKSKVRTAIKNVRLDVEKKDKEAASKDLKLAVSLIDRSVVKGIQHSKTAARQKAEISKLVNTL